MLPFRLCRFQGRGNWGLPRTFMPSSDPKLLLGKGLTRKSSAAGRPVLQSPVVGTNGLFRPNSIYSQGDKRLIAKYSVPSNWSYLIENKPHPHSISLKIFTFSRLYHIRGFRHGAPIWSRKQQHILVFYNTELIRLCQCFSVPLPQAWACFLPRVFWRFPQQRPRKPPKKGRSAAKSLKSLPKDHVDILMPAM